MSTAVLSDCSGRFTMGCYESKEESEGTQPASVRPFASKRDCAIHPSSAGCNLLQPSGKLRLFRDALKQVCGRDCPKPQRVCLFISPQQLGVQHQLDLAAYQHNVHSFEEQVHGFPDAPQCTCSLSPVLRPFAQRDSLFAYINECASVGWSDRSRTRFAVA